VAIHGQAPYLPLGVLPIGQYAWMANGTRGDHPITDVVAHHLDVFSPEVDRLILEIDELGGWNFPGPQDDRADDLLSAENNLRNFRAAGDEAAADRLVANIRQRLTELRDQLRSAAT
jgi:hypothetical protein